MKSGLYAGIASFVMLMLTFCFLCSFTFSEARDLRDEEVSGQGIALVISTPESKPYEDIIRQAKLGGLKFHVSAEMPSQKVCCSRSGKDVVQGIGRRMAMAVVYLMDRSPGIGHNAPHLAPDSM